MLHLFAGGPWTQAVGSFRASTSMAGVEIGRCSSEWFPAPTLSKFEARTEPSRVWEEIQPGVPTDRVQFSHGGQLGGLGLREHKVQPADLQGDQLHACGQASAGPKAARYRPPWARDDWQHEGPLCE